MAENTTSGATVTVACRLPNGFEIMLYDMVEEFEYAPGGAQKIKKARPRNMRPIKLNGFSHPQNKAAKHQIVEGFGLTFNVPKEPMAEWLKLHAEQDYIKNGLIFIQDGRRETEAQLKDHAGQKSGLERLDPRDKKSLGPKIQAADKAH